MDGFVQLPSPALNRPTCVGNDGEMTKDPNYVR